MITLTAHSVSGGGSACYRLLPPGVVSLNGLVVYFYTIRTSRIGGHRHQTMSSEWRNIDAPNGQLGWCATAGPMRAQTPRIPVKVQVCRYQLSAVLGVEVPSLATPKPRTTPATYCPPPPRPGASCITERIRHCLRSNIAPRRSRRRISG